MIILIGKTFKSAVSFIDPVIDPTTRVAKVRTEVNNVSRLLKPEMFAYGNLNISLQPKQQKVLVPQSAVLWTGKESLVYLKKNDFEQPTFEYRITIGLGFGDHYVVEEGLKKGDEVVTRGSFTIDAAAQLSGKISMMNPKGTAINSMPGMDMSGMDMK